MRFKRMTDKSFQHIYMYEGSQVINHKRETVVAIELEFDDKTVSIENVWRVPKFKGIKALPKVVRWIEKTFNKEQILCLPLKKYRSYYESLGFTQHHIEGEDIYYAKQITKVS